MVFRGAFDVTSSLREVLKLAYRCDSQATETGRADVKINRGYSHEAPGALRNGQVIRRDALSEALYGVRL